MSGILEMLTRVDRRIGLAVAALIPIILVAVVMLVFFSGGDGEDADADLLIEELLIPESEVDVRVAATIEAIPTPEPTSTPDVAATVAAERATNRVEVAPELRMSELEVRSGVLSPYLTGTERQYLADAGERIWHYVKIWVHLREVISAEVIDWEFSQMEYHVAAAQLLLETAPEGGRDRNDEVGDVVRDYVVSLEDGTAGVRSAVSRLADAEILFAESGGVALESHSEALHIVRDVEEYLAEFDQAMSRYGCSICGELFRVGRE